MRIKTFEASTMQEALAMVKNELGEDAVVLNTKHVKAGGIMGLGGAGKVEVMAAIDDDAPLPASQPVTAQTITAQPQPVFSKALSGAAARAYSAAPAAVAAPATVETAPARDAELEQLRNEVRQLASMMSGILPAQQRPAQSGKSAVARLGIDEDLARSMFPDLLSMEDPRAIMSALTSRLEAFACPPALDGQHVIAVVGPTGVGKTTTIAKLAARFALEHGKRVAMVTADTFRIGAVEQLRTYARIMGVPLETALSPEDVAAGIRKHSDKDIILVDTVGRSQRSEEHLSDLKLFVDAARPTDTYLVVSASLSSEIQNEVVDRFSMLSPTRLVITKLDECPARGCLVNLPLRTGLAISCVTAGQNVPQDLEYADAGKIARAVVEVTE